MARIRSFHPGFFTDEAIVSLSPWAQLMLLGLMTESDDQGVFEWKPVGLKMRIFPAANVDIVALLKELEGANTIKKVEHDGTPYGLVRNFRKYQRPKYPKSVHPMKDDWAIYVALVKPIGGIDGVEDEPFPRNAETGPQMEDVGCRREEVAEIEIPPPASTDSAAIASPADKRGSRLPENWSLSPDLRDFATDLGLDPDLTRDEFVDYWRGVPGTRGRKLDWPGTFRNRCRELGRPGKAARKTETFEQRRIREAREAVQ